MRNTMQPIYAIIGGGAAGFFGAVTCARLNPQAKVLLLEKSKALLSKVKISGGGRCNVTHACFDPKILSRNYPRGSKELIGPFHQFQPKDTIEWFESRGVQLKTEEDGRMFPTTDNSETIIQCLMNEARSTGVEIRLLQHIDCIQKAEDGFVVQFANNPPLQCKKILLATGSNKDGYMLAESFGHSIVPPVPSLFTFNIPDSPLHELAGISVEHTEVTIKGTNLKQDGPLLITHWGFSGPAALKLSAWGARVLHEVNYHAELIVNWLPGFTNESLLNRLIGLKNQSSGQSIGNHPLPALAKQLWKALLAKNCIDPQQRLGDVSHKQLAVLAEKLQGDEYSIQGKTTYKQEFVTSGGIALDEVNFKTMESKKCPGVYFAGEILNIDAVTGGFNFQNAWTTGWIAGKSMGIED